MPIRLQVESDLPALISKIDNLRRDQLPYAIARAVTSTAQKVKTALEHEMPYAFDRPTPWTLGGLFMSPATKQTPVAMVWLKDEAFKGTPAAKYLLPEIASGARNVKRFERRLQITGILPPGMFVVPGAAAPLDQYGNIKASEIERILSALASAEITAGYQANRTRSSRKRKGKTVADYFVGKPGGAPLGIYRRYAFAHGSAVKPILIFVRQPMYRQRYRFQEIAEQAVREEFPSEFSAAYREAVASAK